MNNDNLYDDKNYILHNMYQFASVSNQILYRSFCIVYNITGILRSSGGATSNCPVLRPAGHLADEIPGGRVSVPDALLGAKRGEQHLPLPPDQGAEAAEGRQRRVRD